ncbi:MAG: hypothetical protein ACTHOF_18020 [Flavisolibacter sp.]|jgi:hypothetical protein
MSFNTNDINNTINLGNYEEYFVLYMDNELNDDQRKMVDAFLLANPDLQADLEILMSTKLPEEVFSFDKEELLSGSMKMNVVDEDLLLYIDNELPSDKKKIVELELATNKTYQLQYQQIFQTKLDAFEVIAYPNKEELYHRTERVIAFKPWMRAAAAIIAIAATGILYFTNSSSTPVVPVSIAETKTPAQPVANPVQQNAAIVKQSSPQIANASPATKRASEDITNVQEQNRNGNHTAVQVNDIARIDESNQLEQEHTLVAATNAIALNATMEATTASFDPSEQIINKSRVTSALDQRNTINEPTPESVADNSEKKGSFKSFLRKATRMIERKTGIDATDGDDELLIGAVAVKLK